MTASPFAAQLTTQIGEEFAAHQQYLAVAAHYESLTLPQLAGFFYRQAREESGHAKMMVQYLLDTDQPVRIPSVAEPVNDFDGIIAPVELGDLVGYVIEEVAVVGDHEQGLLAGR